jgi:hypothetical protein
MLCLRIHICSGRFRGGPIPTFSPEIYHIMLVKLNIWGLKIHDFFFFFAISKDGLPFWRSPPFRNFWIRQWCALLFPPMMDLETYVCAAFCSYDRYRNQCLLCFFVVCLVYNPRFALLFPPMLGLEAYACAAFSSSDQCKGLYLRCFFLLCWT